METGLENLESIFSTGVDLRQARQPMMGIMLNDFNERIAGEIGVPVTEGVRIDQPIEGMGAEKAGLLSNDVIVEMAGVPIQGFGDLGAVVQQRVAVLGEVFGADDVMEHLVPVNRIRAVEGTEVRPAQHAGQRDRHQK